MDLLAQRYASPFLMFEEFIRLHQLHDFVLEVLKNMAAEKVHNARWDVWLHKVFTKMSFDEYVRLCEEQPQVETQEMSNEQIGGIINDSKQLLEGFVPE